MNIFWQCWGGWCDIDNVPTKESAQQVGARFETNMVHFWEKKDSAVLECALEDMRRRSMRGLDKRRMEREETR